MSTDAAFLVAFGEGLRAPQHRLGEAEDVARREDRRHRLARALPDLAFRGQQAVAQDRAQDLLAHRRHLVVLGVVDQHMADERRIVGDDQRAADAVHRYPRLVVGGLAPQFERVAVDDADHLQRRRRRAARRRRGRNEGRRLAVHQRLRCSTDVVRGEPAAICLPEETSGRSISSIEGLQPGGPRVASSRSAARAEIPVPCRSAVFPLRNACKPWKNRPNAYI